MQSFNNKLVLITGGSSGIGLALAKMLSAKGANVWIIARDQSKLEDALMQINKISKQSDRNHGFLSIDITDERATTKCISQWIEYHGTPDLLINSAGVAHPGYFEQLPIDIFQWTMQVNYFGMVHVIKAVIPYMIKQKSGYIVNLSSEAGFIGVFGYTAYSASKFAVRGFSDALRSELKPLGIDMSIVFPPDTDTPQLEYEKKYKPFETKMIAGSSKMMSPEKVASIILKGIKYRQYIIIPGSEGKLFFWLTSFLNKGTYPIMDMMVKSAQKKKIKKMSERLE